jgi:hypothetical protein
MNGSAATAAKGCAYLEQFHSAISCTEETANVWMEKEIARYGREFGMEESEAWRTIICNLTFYSGFYGTAAVRRIRKLFGGFDDGFDRDDYQQWNRVNFGDCEKRAKDSPV